MPCPQVKQFQFRTAFYADKMLLLCQPVEFEFSKVEKTPIVHNKTSKLDVREQLPEK